MTDSSDSAWSLETRRCSVKVEIIWGSKDVNTEFLSLPALFFTQVGGLWFVSSQLWLSGLSSKVQPLPHRAGPEWQQEPAGLRSEAAVCFSGESRMQAGDSEVRQPTAELCGNHVQVVMTLTLLKHREERCRVIKIPDMKQKKCSPRAELCLRSLHHSGI